MKRILIHRLSFPGKLLVINLILLLALAPQWTLSMAQAQSRQDKSNTSKKRVPNPQALLRQIEALNALEQDSAKPISKTFNDGLGAPAFLSGRIPIPQQHRTVEAKVAHFFGAYKDAYRMTDPSSELKIISVKLDDLGATHVRLQQLYKGIKVYGAELLWHLNANGEVTHVHGKYVPDIEIETAPKISSEQAIAVVKGDLLRQHGAISFERYYSPELNVLNEQVIDPSFADETNLVWFIRVRTTKPAGDWHYFIDAASGRILSAFNNAMSDINSGIYDASCTSTTGDDLQWYEDNVKIRTGAPPSQVANLNTFVTNYYSYLNSRFGIHSVNGGHLKLIGRANYDDDSSSPCNFSNACWNCRDDEAVFGPGYAIRDIVAHEFTHGLVEKSGGDLQYQNQSGALNESFADVFGEFVDCFIADDCSTWIHAQGPGFSNRNLQNPPASRQPDHINSPLYVPPGSSDYGGVHTNSGIPNKVAYLIAQGGTHYGTAVTGIGISKTEQLYYRTLINNGLSNTATFEEARDVMLEVCQQMAEDGVADMTKSNCRSVFNAWKSVGIGDLTQTVAGATNEKNDNFGRALATGDFNGDGKKDLAVGVPGENYDGAKDAGIVIVYYGSDSGITAAGAERLGQNLAGASIDAGDRFGAVLAAGDFNGDGKDDLAVGVPGENYDGADDAGIVIVFFGSSSGLLPARYERLGQGHAGARVENGDGFGSALAVGDFNADGKDDLAVGVPGENYDGADNAGMVVVFYGSSGGLLPANWERLGQGFTDAQAESGDKFGSALAAGDLNGDGKDDLAVGVPGEDYASASDAGIVIVFYGSTSGLLPARWESLGQGSADARIDSGDEFGSALAIGDINGDGKGDLAVGVPGENYDGADNAGIVIVFYGSARGLRPVTYERFGQGITGAKVESGDRFGSALTIGDFNGNGKDDLAVGVPGENFGGATNTGMVVVLYGSTSGLRPATWQRLGQRRVGGADQSGDQFGFALAAGDFDGDGKDDLAIGAPFEDILGAEKAGKVYLYEGSASGLTGGP